MFFIRHVLPVVILSTLIGIVIAKLVLNHSDENSKQSSPAKTQTSINSSAGITESRNDRNR